MRDKQWDLVVVGGGAAGFFGAITAAEILGDNARVLILEKSPHFLGKVKISGGGRCNLSHACFDPREFSKNYPRGEKTLLGPLHHWGAQETVDWFESRGVKLKTESDGRVFPVSDDSQTVIDCLVHQARAAGVEMQSAHGVEEVRSLGGSAQHQNAARFEVLSDKGKTFSCRSLLLATGGTRNASGEKLARQLGHGTAPATPSLFTFKISDERIDSLQGLAVAGAQLAVKDCPKLASSGPLLITHWGLSGPAVLKLSAWGARDLAALDYHFTLRVNWIAACQPAEALITDARREGGKRRVAGASVFKTLPKRLWQNLCHTAGIADGCTWSQLPKAAERKLLAELRDGHFQVTGKSMNKDEFVTCGGVHLNEINLRNMESRLSPGLFFAGEILDIDGLTGGFNFQNAWTTAHLAGQGVGDGMDGL